MQNGKNKEDKITTAMGNALGVTFCFIVMLVLTAFASVPLGTLLDWLLDPLVPMKCLMFVLLFGVEAIAFVWFMYQRSDRGE